MTTQQEKIAIENYAENMEYRTKYRSNDDLRAAVDRYMTFYNKVRPHVKNTYKTPLAKEPFLWYFAARAARISRKSDLFSRHYYSKQGILEED